MNIIPITDFNKPELQIYHSASEVQLLHYFEPNPGIFIAETALVIGRALADGYEPISFLMEDKYLQANRGNTDFILNYCQSDRELPIYTASAELLKRLTGFPLTRGVLCAMRRRRLPSAADICRGARRIVVLENVMNPTNVGAIFRSAAALGMDGILLTPGSSDPLYRRAIRVSMGTVFQIPWTFLDEKQEAWPFKGQELLHSLGFQTAAMALREDTVAIDDPVLISAEKLALVLGTEGDGLADCTIAECDYRVKIPMAYGVDSLNVAAAAAIAFWCHRR